MEPDRRDFPGSPAARLAAAGQVPAESGPRALLVCRKCARDDRLELVIKQRLLEDRKHVELVAQLSQALVSCGAADDDARRCWAPALDCGDEVDSGKRIRAMPDDQALTYFPRDDVREVLKFRKIEV